MWPFVSLLSVKIVLVVPPCQLPLQKVKGGGQKLWMKNIRIVIVWRNFFEEIVLNYGIFRWDPNIFNPYISTHICLTSCCKKKVLVFNHVSVWPKAQIVDTYSILNPFHFYQGIKSVHIKRKVNYLISTFH